jgi:hypothetical protein
MMGAAGDLSDPLMTTTKSIPPAPIVRFDIASIPKKPPAPSVPRRVKVERRRQTDSWK